ETRNYTNWELSADRANAARRSLERGGVRDQQLAQVVGMSSSVPFDKDNPDSPINRRISILVMNEQADKKLKAQQDGEPLPDDPEFAPGQSAEPAPQEQQTLNDYEACERLRKTMTRKNAESRPAAGNQGSGEFFE